MAAHVVKLMLKPLPLPLEDYDACEFTTVLIAMVNLGGEEEKNIHKLSTEDRTPVVLFRKLRRTISGVIQLNIMICFVRDVVCE
jgi:hypothetical protein